VKSFMTFLVVMHHTLIGYGGLGNVDGFVVGNFHNVFGGMATAVLGINQSFFMCLFFFISGYFTPSSLARKGVRDFIREKFMRLGLPLFVFFFFLNVFVVWFGRTVVVGDEWPANFWPVGVGPPWFLQVLLLFNCAYVLCMGNAELPTVKCPSPWTLTALGCVMGLVQAFFVWLDFTLWGIPGPCQGSLPFDVLFFCGGCLAKKNKWLDDFQDQMREGPSALCLRLGTLLLVASMAVITMTVEQGPFHEVASAGRKLAAAAEEEQASFGLEDVVAQVWFGLITMTLSMCITQLFSVYFNFTSKTSRFFSEAAYGVYIIHPVVWPVVSYTYVMILRAMGVELTFSYATDMQAVSSDDIGAWRVALGFFYTFCISNLILWPTAFYLRKLPGLREVL